MVGLPPAVGPGARSTATSRSCPTRGGRPRRCPTSRPTSTTARSTTRRSPCGFGVVERNGARWPMATGCWSGQRRPGRFPGNLAVGGGRGHHLRLRGRRGRAVLDRREQARFGSGHSRGRRCASCSTLRGAELVGTGYEPPFDWFGEERDRGAFRVISADEVTTDEGTGLVHMAPAYGEADFAALQAAGLDVLVDPVDAEGRFTEAIPSLAGTRVKDADLELDRDAEGRGLLYRREPDPTQLPVLLPHRHAAHLQGDTHLVRAGRGIPRPDGGGEQPDPLGARARRCQAFRQLARGCPRLGDQPQPLLGELHPDLGVRRRGHQVCIGSIDELAELSGVQARRPAHASTSTRSRSPAPSCGSYAAGARGARLLVRVGIDALRPAALSLREPGAFRAGLSGPFHRRGPRPDAGLVLHAAGALHGDLRHTSPSATASSTG